MKAMEPAPYGSVLRYSLARMMTLRVVSILSPGPVGSPSVIVMLHGANTGC